MKTILFLLCFSVLFLTSCKKAKDVYTPEINKSINAQTTSMAIIYKLVRFHLDNANGTGQNETCYVRTADTTGNLISDNVQATASECFLIKAKSSSGSYTSQYSTSFPSVLDTATIEVNFSTNGVNLKGRIKYFYQTLNLIRINAEDLSVTGVYGEEYSLHAQLFMTIGSQTTDFNGTMNFTGATNFDWKNISGISGPTYYDFGSAVESLAFTAGKAEFNFPGKKITENFGDGQSDELATLEDETGERMILVLPKF